MKPLELSSVAEVWKTALGMLGASLESMGRELQVWFPWGRVFRGHDAQGYLPPTELPHDLLSPIWSRYAGRSWRSLPVAHGNWLISLKLLQTPAPEAQELALPADVVNMLGLLGEVVKMECLLGLTLRILENRAGERIGHWERVRNLCVAVGHRMGLTGRELVDLELSGLLHDIGKVALPAKLWEETRPLSHDERRQMETHSMVGAGMIREIPGMDRVAESVLAHHETPDGHGYPRGLSREEIPLNSLVVGAVDAFDAMTHYRPYAAERTYKDSIAEMMANPEKYDDRVLWALQEVLRNLGILETRPVSPANPRFQEGPLA